MFAKNAPADRVFDVWLRFSDDAGLTYKAEARDYVYANIGRREDAPDED